MPIYVGENGVKRLWSRVNDLFVKKKMEKNYQRIIFRMSIKLNLKQRWGIKHE